ncbi:MAG: hypothetical protein R2695_16745 [Acidimicrobiales bacterium]
MQTADAAVVPSGEKVPIGETFTVAEGDGATTGAGFPDVSSDPVTGRSLVIYNWVEDAPVGADPSVEGGVGIIDEIHGRVIDNAGMIGPDFRIDVTLPSTGFDDFEPPTAAWNSTLTEWLVTWTDDEIVYGQRVDSDGSLIGNNFVIAASKVGKVPTATDNFYDIEQVEAEWSPTDQVYLVSWKARGDAAGVEFDQTILATLIDKSGNNKLNGFVKDVSQEEANDGVAVSYSPDSDVWLVAWERQASNEQPGARVIKATASGTKFNMVFVTAPLAISNTGDERRRSQVEWDSARDRFIIIWRADHTDDAVNNYEHFFNFISPTGAFVEGNEEQFSTTGSYPYRGRVAYSPVDDEYAVVSHVDGTDDYELFTWTISGDGNTTGETTVLASAQDKRARPAVSYGGGCFHYVWWDQGQFWDSSRTLPDAISTVFGCEGCEDFGPAATSSPTW